VVSSGSWASRHAGRVSAVACLPGYTDFMPGVRWRHPSFAVSRYCHAFAAACWCGIALPSPLQWLAMCFLAGKQIITIMIVWLLIAK